VTSPAPTQPLRRQNHGTQVLPPPWSQTAKQVSEVHDTTASGLSQPEAETRLSLVGKNQLRQARVASALQILVSQLKSLIVLLLLGASVLSFLVGDALEGSAIGAAIVLTVLLGFITELRAVRSMEALRQLGAVRARVRRDGIERTISAEELVPGDVLVFEGGERITADVRVVEASKLQADESALTGESVPVGKTDAVVPLNAPLAERKNMLYQGATITRGAGMGVVVETGMRTELGRIAALVDEADDEATPLEQRLATLGQRLLWVCLGIAGLTSVVGIATGRQTMLMIETGIALAVAAVPEGLPVVATVALARGMWRLAARHALIKRLAAVETLGATGVIVADKTGTLTENHLSVMSFVIADETYDKEDLPSDEPALQLAIELGVLCNNASLAGDVPSGDPLEIALLQAAAGVVDRTALRQRWPEHREEAFDPAIKMMATVHVSADDTLVAVKGAPEAVLDACTSQWRDGETAPLADERRAQILERSDAMARTGLRMLAVAQRLGGAPGDTVYEGLSFVGLIALADPPRREVTVPLEACRRAGIRVVMATGDQPATAESIARAVGLVDTETATVVHGADLADLDNLSDDRREQLLSTQIFARVTPEQKLDIIELYQRSGAIVAMTGDGVNDAPALRKAEIGIAMGERGTAVAREAADMVLKDDSFDSIVSAIEQGRAIFENIRRFVVYLLSCNVSELLVVTAAVLFGAPLPLLPLQILFLNLVTDVFPALALGFGQGDPRAMLHPPRDAREPIVTPRHWLRICTYALVITGAVLGSMLISNRLGASTAETTTVSFLTLGFAQLWHVFNMRARGSRVLNNDVVANPWIWSAVVLCALLLVAAAVFGPLARVLHATPLTAELWLVVVAMSLAPLLVGQLWLGHARVQTT